MNEKEIHPVESLEAWLSEKPYWEQYVWKLNLEKESLTEEDIDQCYQYLADHLGIGTAGLTKKEPISLENRVPVAANNSISPHKVILKEIKSFIGVNALSSDCCIKCGPHLTLIYGMNGSGKSGVCRLLCYACFSRGEREILPNLREHPPQGGKVGATFIIDDGFGNPATINYALGFDNKILKRFSVFDAQSVRIHLDEPNSVNFVPAQIRIFDKVAETISTLERRLDHERQLRRRDNPFASMFLDQNEVSNTSTFCKSISSSDKEADFLALANFNVTDEEDVNRLKISIEEKRKLDIPKRKSQLTVDRDQLRALKTTLESILNQFTIEQMQALNRLTDGIYEKKRILEGLSIQKFDDGLFKTIGSPEWKALIAAAKVLHEKEKVVNGGQDPNHCGLCHQLLRDKENTLFRDYWTFLDSKAEQELAQLMQTQAILLEALENARTAYPQFLNTDAGIRVLTDEDPSYFHELKSYFVEMSSVLDDWISKLRLLQIVNRNNVPTVDLNKIETLITTKVTEEANLVDPSVEIARLNVLRIALQHKKDATSVKDAALDYIRSLQWMSKANGVSFAGIKGALTKKRTEAFQIAVGNNYMEIFNKELKEFGCSFDITLSVSGDQGNTVKEYTFEFERSYIPSRILSEGEQNICSIADYLSEIQIDDFNCGIIFDDPVTSMDHERKDRIAKRLVSEAGKRQVIIFTHDLVFMSQLVKNAGNQTPFVAHWMRNVNGVPGCMEENTSPKLAALNRLKADSQEAVQGFESLNAKAQEHALGIALDYLRSACEALIEEILFAKTIQRYDDHIRVQNLEEAVFDQPIALKIVELHGKISETILAHNRSDLRSENLRSLNTLTALRSEFDELEAELKAGLKNAKKAREERKSSKVSDKAGW